MFQSPLKTVSEKIKPVESKSSVSSLKFERPSDFKKFINFIKNETKELEKIKLPTTAEVKPKSKRKGALGLLGLGLFGLLGSAFGSGEEGDDRFSIGGGTRSQFKPVKIPLVGGVVNQGRNNANVRLRTEGVTKRYKEIRKKRFRTKTQKEIKATDDVVKQQKKVNRKSRNIIKKYNKIRKEINTSRPKKKINIAQVKSTLKDYFDPRVQKMAKKFGLADEILDPNLFALDDFMALDLKNLSEAEKANLTDKFLKAFPDDVPEGQYGKYSAEEMKKIEKLFGKQQDKLKIEEDLLKEQKKELRKIRSKRYSFKGDPNFKFKFDLFGKNVKFSPKDFLNKKFTQFGTATKPARDVVQKAVSKIPLSKSTGLFLGKNLMRLGKGIDFLTAGYEAFKLYQGFRKGDNIFTAYYDLGVAIHNMFQPDKAKLMTYITNHQDSRLKVKKQEKNQKIKEEIQKAKEAQALSGGFNPINKASDIVPFAVQKTGQQIMLSSPAFTGYRFILDKLYKQ